MKIIALSDLHGDLPEIKEECDVICICGDIVPLRIQRDYTASVVWFTETFKPWAMDLNCKRVIFIAGNHDFMFYDNKMGWTNDTTYIINNSYNWGPSYALEKRSKLNLDGKLVYLEDSGYEYGGVTFWGTPWCPDLRGWAFYGSEKTLNRIYGFIPDKVDVLLTHTPGSDMNDTGTSLELDPPRKFGCKELTNAVLKRDVKLWLCGHVHTGNHDITEYSEGRKVVNVSMKNEDYKMVYKPFIIDI